MKMNFRLAALAAGLCLASLLLPAQSFAQPLTHAYLRTADKAYAQNDWTLAEENYRKAIFHDTTTYATDSSRLQQYLPRELYNLGNALYLQQRYQEALKAYQNAFLNSSGQLQTQALFNLGNTFYALEKYKEAAEAFKEVLRRQPGYPDAAYNLAQSLRKLKEQQQKEQQKQQDKEKNNEQQDKEQQEQQDKDQQEQQNKEQQEQEKKDQQQQQDQQQQNQQQQQQQQQQGKEQQEQEQKQQQQQQGQEGQQGEEQQQNQQQQAGQAREGQARAGKKLTREEALQLLRIMQEEEMKVQKGKRKFKGTHNKSDKDW